MFEKLIKLNKLYYIISGIALLAIIVLFVLTLPEKPLTYMEQLKKAEAYAQKGQVAFAIEHYKRLLNLYPETYQIHIKLAELYLKVKEPDKAKVEYLRAIRIDERHRLLPYIELAKIYSEEEKYNIVEDVLKQMKPTNNKNYLARIGDIYFDWAQHIELSDVPDAIRKYKEAVEYYKKAGSSYKERALDNIAKLYGQLSDELVRAKKINEAIEILELSLDYENNALAHYKLAKIYQDKGEEKLALNEYSKAFTLDPKITNKSSYITLLLKKAQQAKQKGDKTTSDYYYSKAKKLDSAVDVPTNPDVRVLFSLVAIKVNEDIENDILVPGIIFKIINISEDVLDNVKVKVVFIKDKRPINTRVITVADEENTLKGDSYSNEISVFSQKPVKHIFDDHKLRVDVYISQSEDENWKLFRKVDIERQRDYVNPVNTFTQQEDNYSAEDYLQQAKKYALDKQFSYAQDEIKKIRQPSNKKLLKEIGDIYFDWAQYAKTTNIPEAIRKFKEARGYYKKAETGQLEASALNYITLLYAKTADQLLVSGKTDQAIKMYELSIDYEDNHIARYQLAKIYEGLADDDRALKEYERAYKLDPEDVNKADYIKLLVKKALQAEQAGDKTTSEFYYKKASRIDSKFDLPLNPDQRLLFKFISTEVKEDIDNDLLVPGVSFKIVNISRQELDNVRARVVFLHNNEPISTQLLTVANKENTLKPHAHSREIILFSNATVKHVFDDHDLRVQVFISQSSPDDWKPYRNIVIERQRPNLRVVE